jgi:hypothetical protein
MPQVSPFPSSTSCCGFFTGNERNITASIRLKMAVFAPIPSASESSATSVMPGERSIARRP